jgi:type IV secretory pathway VirB2 component (pilin)
VNYRSISSSISRARALARGSAVLDRVAVLSTAFVLSALSAGATSTGLPWENGLNKIQSSMSGPVMLAFGVIVIVAIAVTLAFAGEIVEILKRAGGSVLALGAGFGALAMVGALYTVSGAVI